MTIEKMLGAMQKTAAKNNRAPKQQQKGPKKPR